jgi:hypothetical protein
LIRIRTQAGTLMDARFSTREAAEGYRRVLVGGLSSPLLAPTSA